MIQLNNGYSIKTDSSGVTLYLKETRQREETDKETKKKTGKLVDYEFTDEYYLLNVKQALTYYLQLELKNCEDVKGLMTKMEEVESLIKNLNFASKEK
jgi:hypothetical protein